MNGESTLVNHPFKPNDDFIPAYPYGLSKYEVEKELQALAKETGMEVVIIRPPLVYGAGVKGDFASMLTLCASSMPLPFSAINQNKRSLVAVENLVDLIITCIEHPNAANQTFLVSDGYDVSTSCLFKQLSASLGRLSGKRTVMLFVPVFLYKLLITPRKVICWIHPKLTDS